MALVITEAGVKEVVSFRLPQPIVALLDAHQAAMRETGMNPLASRTDALIDLLTRASTKKPSVEPPKVPVLKIRLIAPPGSWLAPSVRARLEKELVPIIGAKIMKKEKLGPKHRRKPRRGR